MLRWTASESWPMALKSLSALQPLGRAGRGSITVATDAMVDGGFVWIGGGGMSEERKKNPDGFWAIHFFPPTID